MGVIIPGSPHIGQISGGGSASVAVDDITDAGETGKAVLKAETPAAAQEVLALGTAATKNIGTAPGNVLSEGAFGLSSTLKALSGTNLNTLQTFGFYVVTNAVNGPTGSSTGAVFVHVRTWQSGTGTAGYRVAQELVGYGQSASIANRVWRRTYGGTAWSAWQEFYSDLHKPAATTTKTGFVKQATLVANSTATDVAGLNAKINELLAAMKTAGLMATAAAIPGVTKETGA